MHNTSILDFMIVVDDEKMISSVFPNDSLLSDFIHRRVDSIVAEDSINHFQTFMKKLEQKNVAFNHRITLAHLDQTYDCKLNGYKDDNHTLIFVFSETASDNDVLKQLMFINNQQVNEIRILHKQLHQQDPNIYNEISKLNSELLNSKRIIEKQNAELHRYNALLKKMSIEDSLTGSYNRRYFYDYMKETVLSSQKDVFHSLIMIDFNDFKLVNDQFGHDAGDRLLITFVTLTRKTIIDKGDIFRIGGDEFVILLFDTKNNEAESYMIKLCDSFKSISNIASLSYGIIEFNESELNHEFDLSSIVIKADEMMYKNKRIFKREK